MESNVAAQVLQFVLATAQVVAAVAIVWTAILMKGSSEAANRSADAAEKAIRGQLLARLLDQYGSPEYLAATRNLADWAGPKGSGGPPNPTLDDSRRAISSYFRKLYHLHRRGFITDDDLRDCLAEPYTVGLLLTKVEQAEQVKRQDYDRRVFDFFDMLYHRRLGRPLRDLARPGEKQAGDSGIGEN